MYNYISAPLDASWGAYQQYTAVSDRQTTSGQIPDEPEQAIRYSHGWKESEKKRFLRNRTKQIW